MEKKGFYYKETRGSYTKEISIDIDTIKHLFKISPPVTLDKDSLPEEILPEEILKKKSILEEFGTPSSSIPSVKDTLSAESIKNIVESLSPFNTCTASSTQNESNTDSIKNLMLELSKRVMNNPAMEDLKCSIKERDHKRYVESLTKIIVDNVQYITDSVK
jgi:hypothetical protein